MSTLNVSNITDGTDTVETSYVVNGSAKAWVYWNASTGTPTVNDSLNTSSLTDTSTGQTGLNFSNNMNSADFAVSSTSQNSSSDIVGLTGHSTTSASTVQLNTARPYTAAYQDANRVSFVIHGDLA